MPNMTTIDTKKTNIPKKKQPQLLARLISRGKTQKIHITKGAASREISVSAEAAQIFEKLLDAVDQGKKVTIISEDEELTTQQAADILNVSRPHVVKLLEDGKIPYYLTGKHRRISYSDVQKYKEVKLKKAKKAMLKLAQQAQELNLGYEK